MAKSKSKISRHPEAEDHFPSSEQHYVPPGYPTQFPPPPQPLGHPMPFSPQPPGLIYSERYQPLAPIYPQPQVTSFSERYQPQAPIYAKRFSPQPSGPSYPEHYPPQPSGYPGLHRSPGYPNHHVDDDQYGPDRVTRHGEARSSKPLHTFAYENRHSKSEHVSTRRHVLRRRSSMGGRTSLPMSPIASPEITIKAGSKVAHFEEYRDPTPSTSLSNSPTEKEKDSKLSAEAADIVKRLEGKYQELLNVLSSQDMELSKVMSTEAKLETEETDMTANIDVETCQSESKMDIKLKRLMGKFRSSRNDASSSHQTSESQQTMPVNEHEVGTNKNKESKLKRIQACAMAMTKYLAAALTASAPYAGIAFGPAEICFKGAVLLLQALIHVVEIPDKVALIFEKCRHCIESLGLATTRKAGELTRMIKDVGADIFNSSLLYSYMETIIDVWMTLSQYAVSWVKKGKAAVDSALGTDDDLDILLKSLDDAEKATASDMMFKSAVISARYMGIIKEGVTQLSSDMRELSGRVYRLTENGERQSIDKKLSLWMGFATREMVNWCPTPESLGTMSVKSVRVDCQWILNNPTIQSVLFDETPSSPHPIILLHGSSGTGKTTALWALRDQVSCRDKGREKWSTISFFHQACESTTSFPDNCFRSLCWQLTKRYPNLEESLVKSLTDPEFRCHGAAAIWELVIYEALCKLERKVDDHLLILIDCDAHDPKPLLDILKACSMIPGFRFVIAAKSELDYERPNAISDVVKHVEVAKHTEANAHQLIRDFLLELVKEHNSSTPFTSDPLAILEYRLHQVFQHSGRSFSELNDYINTLRKSTSVTLEILGTDVQSSAWTVSQKAQQETIKKLSADERQELSLILAWLQFGFMPLRIQALSLLSDLALLSSGSRWTRLVRDRIQKKYSYFVRVDDHDIIGWQPDFNPEFILREDHVAKSMDASNALDTQTEDIYMRVLKALFPEESEFERLGLKQALEERKGMVMALNSDNDNLRIVIACLRILLDMHSITSSGASSFSDTNISLEPFQLSKKSNLEAPKALKTYWDHVITTNSQSGLMSSNALGSMMCSPHSAHSLDGLDHLGTSPTLLGLLDEKTTITDRYDQDDVCYMTTYAIACLVPHLRCITDFQLCDDRLKVQLGKLLPRLFTDPTSGYLSLGAGSPKSSSHYWYGTHVKALVSHAESWLKYDDTHLVMEKIFHDLGITSVFKGYGFPVSSAGEETESSTSSSDGSEDDRIRRIRVKRAPTSSSSGSSSGTLSENKNIETYYLDSNHYFLWMLRHLFLEYSGAKRDLLSAVNFSWRVYDNFQNDNNKLSSLSKFRAYTLTLEEYTDFESWARKVLAFPTLSVSDQNSFLMASISILETFCCPKIIPEAQVPEPAIHKNKPDADSHDELAIPVSKYNRAAAGYPGHHCNSDIDAYDLAVFKIIQEAKSLCGVVPYWLLRYISDSDSGYDYLLDNLIQDAAISARFRRSERNSGNSIGYGDVEKPVLTCPPRIIADTLVHVITQVVTASIKQGDSKVSSATRTKDIRLWTRLALHNDSSISTIRSLLLLHNSVYTSDLYSELFRAMDAVTDDWRLLSQDSLLSVFSDSDLAKIIQHAVVSSELRGHVLSILTTINAEVFSKNNIYAANLKHTAVRTFDYLYTFRFPSASCVAESLVHIDKLLNNEYYGTQNLTELQQLDLHLHRFTLTYLCYLCSPPTSNASPLADLESIMDAAKIKPLSDGKIGSIVRNNCFFLWAHPSTRHGFKDWLLGLLQTAVKVYQDQPYSRSGIRRVAELLTSMGDTQFASHAWRVLAALDYYEYVPQHEALTLVGYTRDRLRGHSHAYRNFMLSRTWPSPLPWPIDCEDFTIKLPESLLGMQPIIYEYEERESIEFLRAQQMTSQDKVDIEKRWADYVADIDWRCFLCFASVTKDKGSTIFVCRHCSKTNGIVCEGCHGHLYDANSHMDGNGLDLSVARTTYCYRINCWLRVENIGGFSGKSRSRNEWVSNLGNLLEKEQNLFLERLEMITLDSFFATKSPEPEGSKVSADPKKDLMESVCVVTDDNVVLTGGTSRRTSDGSCDICW